jgi:hypothetical protein
MPLNFRGKSYDSPKLSQTLSEKFLRPAKPKDVPSDEPDRILTPAERKEAMSRLDAIEVKWAKAGLILATALGIIVPVIESSTHPIRKVTNHLHGKNTPGYVVTSTTWLLIGLIVVLFCGLGFWALRRRKRSLVVFTFFVVGFSFTLIFAPLGFALIALGGWLLLRAYRIQKYGTANAKKAAVEARARPPRRERSRTRNTSTTTAATPYKPPTPSKRYTPKAAPRKKVAKPVE